MRIAGTPSRGRQPSEREEEASVEQRIQVGVQCPQCRWKHHMEVEMDVKLLQSPLYQ